MRHKITVYFAIWISILCAQKSQNLSGTFSIKNPFDQKEFIENKGQFDNRFDTGNKVLFSINTMGMDIAFLKNEIIYRIEKNNNKESDHEKEEEFEKEKRKQKIEVDILKLIFDNANSNVELIAEEKGDDYYTYIDENSSNKLHPNTIKAFAYKKIIYKNIYPNIDLEYTIHEKGGLKYSFILHPGADASLIKMHYVSASKIKLSKEKNIELFFREQKLIDHKPITFDEDNTLIESDYNVNKNIVSFTLNNYDKSKKVIIDPWTINPSFLGYNGAYDISKDGSGNVYVSGGSTPYYLKKYNSSGTLMWTFTYPNSQNWYGCHCLDNVGNCFVSYGPWVGISTTKVDPSGAVLYNNVAPTTIYDKGETYKLLYNISTGKLFGVGFYSQNYSTTIRQSVFEFDPSNGNIMGQYDPLTGAEIRSGIIDNNGDLIVYTVPMSGSPSTNNKIIKINSTINSVLFQSSTGSNMGESDQTYVPNWYSGFNGVAADCDNDYYSYDGLLLQKHSKTTGATILGPINVANGQTYRNSGIWVDNCKNTYVGTQNSVLVYDPLLNLVSTIPTAGQVYDIAEGNNGEVLICGQGFVSSITAYACAGSGQVTLNYSDTICSGSSYTLPNGIVVTSTGIYSDTINLKCFDTIFNINLLVLQSALNILDTSICFGVNFPIPGGGTANTSGTYSDTLTAANGCDSIVILNLTVGAQNVQTINVSMCAGSSYILPWGDTASTAGTYNDTLTTNKGCDSIITVNLSLIPLVTQTLNQAICVGDTYTLPGGMIVSIAGTYYDTINSVTGCDTVYTVNLTVNPLLTQLISATICQGNSYTLPDGSSVSIAGTYVDTVAALGCDTVITTVLSISSSISLNSNVSICLGNSYILPGGTSVTTAGMYIDTLSTVSGCDSIITTTLNVLPTVTSNSSATVCQGTSYILPGGSFVSLAGIYKDTLQNTNGCDSVITTTLIVLPNITTNLSGVIQCAGQTYTLPNGDTVSAAGVYNDTLSAINGCDSIVSVTVTVNPSPIASFTANPLTGTAPLLVNFTNTSQNANIYDWNFGDGNTSTLYNPSNVFDSVGNYQVILIVSNGFGCYDTARVNILVYANFYVNVPNVFSPNNDGTNDSFFIITEGIKAMYIEIYDRWGLKLMEWNNPNYKWDGYTAAGLPVVDGTYYYIMKLTETAGKEHILTGHITVVR